MCICVNCHWVDRCKGYHSVENQHGVKHLSNEPDIDPVEPYIHVSVLDLPEGDIGIEWDVRSCGSFIEDLGRWQRLRPGQEIPR